MKTKLSRRSTVFIWIGGIGVVIGTLIYLEQIAVLYLFATIALVVLLLIVAFSDLENIDRETAEGFARGRE